MTPKSLRAIGPAAEILAQSEGLQAHGLSVRARMRQSTRATIDARISKIQIDDSALPPPTPEIEQERKVAIFDLLEDNSFALAARSDRPEASGPYHLLLAIRNKRLVFDVQTKTDRRSRNFTCRLALSGRW